MSELQPVSLAADAPYVNALLLQMLRGVEEVLGQNGLHVVLRTSGLGRFVDNPPPNNLDNDVLAREYAMLNEAIEEFTGRAGKGMLQRIGRASFRWGIREQSAVMGLAGIALKALPQRLRMRAILLGLRKGLMDIVEYGLVDVKDEDGILVYTDYACTICHTRQAEQPICHLYIGTLGEAMAYATGKDFRSFDITETQCKAKGDGICRFEIRNFL
jgi:predicted hydrocarbon binding protein